MKLPKKIRVRVTARHYVKSPSFYDPENCPLALAIKEKFHDALVELNLYYAFINGRSYEINNFISADVDTNSYGFQGPSAFVDAMKKRAEARKKVISFKVELVKN